MRRFLALSFLFALASLVVAAPVSYDQAVLVHFDCGNRDWSLFLAFEKTFESDIAKSGVGIYDGNELAQDGSDGFMYIYGADADKLFAFVKPRLVAATLLKNIRVTLRYGSVDDKNAKELHINLGS